MRHPVRLTAAVLAALAPLGVCGRDAVAAEAPFHILRTFSGTTMPRTPRPSLVKARDGFIYGVTSEGGAHAAGTLFRLAPDGAVVVLHSFGRTDWDTPDWPISIMEGLDGAVYGFTYRTVFRMSLDGGFSVLMRLLPESGLGSISALTQMPGGAFYGLTTDYGDNHGVVFRVLPGGAMSIVYTFTDGWGRSFGDDVLVSGRDGNLYGIRSIGGPSWTGVFFLVTPAGAAAALHLFSESTDGARPTGLLQGIDGNFYGTTPWGGPKGGGTVFRITSTGVLTVIHAFARGSDLQAPSQLTQAPDGTLFAIENASDDYTTVFALHLDGTLTGLSRFPGYSYYDGPLLIDGEFVYGTVPYFPNHPGWPSWGGIYRVSRTSAFSWAHLFSPGSRPIDPGPLVEGADGHLYGASGRGGWFDRGTIFRLTRTGIVTTLHEFSGGADGRHPHALTWGKDGFLYGLAGKTIFKLSPSGAFAVVATIDVDANGRYYCCVLNSLMQASDGYFYGTGGGGPYESSGFVFRLRPSGEVDLVPTDPWPAAGLLEAADGHFYGVTYFGGFFNRGSIFRMTRHLEITTLHSFQGCYGCPDGAFPSGSLVQASDGYLYGTTAGYWSGEATIFRISLAGALSTIARFPSPTGYEGPPGVLVPGLLQATDGKLYGTTPAQVEGGGRAAVVFSLTLDGTLRVLHAFTGGADGRQTFTPVIQGRDGHLYGTALGGPGRSGVVFMIPLPPGIPRDVRGAGVPAGVQLSWAPVPGATHYAVRRGFTPGTRVVIAAEVRGTTFIDTLPPGRRYYYDVIAVNAWGAGDPSAIVAAQRGLAAAGDLDGDRRRELTTYRRATGQWTIRRSSSGYQQTTVVGFGGPADVPLTGDFDGDGRIDLATFRGATGYWYIRLAAPHEPERTYQWGTEGDVPLVADFDGDLKADLTVYRPSDGVWYIWQSTRGLATHQWGAPGDRPVVADFDGDGRSELTVFRPSTGEWFTALSSAGYQAPGWRVQRWGNPADEPVAADYDGDGRTELALYRPIEGLWFVWESATMAEWSWKVYRWGHVGVDQPIVGDVDGDGRSDLITYRPTTSEWFLAYSSTNFTTVGVWLHGAPGDVPVP